jgi:hypothetical protein
MLRTGHEGPYSLESIMKRKVSLDVKVWAEGLNSPLTLKMVIENSQKILEKPSEEDELPPLPDLSEEDEVIPPIPVLSPEISDQVEDVPIIDPKLKKYFGLVFGVLFLLIFGLKQWVKTQEVFTISRASGMGPELFKQINADFQFERWDKKIFFKEYTPADMSHIWLVTSGFQECQVEASFTSLKGKLLALKDDKISFKSVTKLNGHIAEFSQFDFSSGNRILPGLYEMDLKATGCVWDGLGPKLGNLFKSPDASYVTRMKVVLFHKGNVEFNLILDKLIRKKLALEVKDQNLEELFWQDLQQKLQTLVAITLQIEQLFLELLERPPGDLKKNLKMTVDKYTQKFGSTLTEFVVQNEKYFQELKKSEVSNLSQKRNYEDLVRLTSKNIGLESMKIIEQLQGWKKPTQNDLSKMEIKVKHQFEALKKGLNQRLIQITEDRTK